jgi:gamma-glutamylcyclotransferase (GGCT)/AIG2-like uncharacterized protein YtfP
VTARDEPDELFVYGTLVPGGTSWDVIAASVLGVRPATVAGRLYDTGRGYPAATFGRRDDELVHGVVLTLLVDGTLWERLDAFEAEEYERVVVRVGGGAGGGEGGAGGGDAGVFTYDWRAPLDGLVPIPGGRWHELAAKNPD